MWHGTNILERQYITNQNLIQEEIKSVLKSVNAYCRSIQKILSSRLLSET
jgi:phage host-nuclease inhibitor protein Gam